MELYDVASFAACISPGVLISSHLLFIYLLAQCLVHDRHYIIAVEWVNTLTSDTRVLMGVAENATFSLNLLPLGHRAGPSPGPLGWGTGPRNSVLHEGTCPFSLAPRLLDPLITSSAASLS